MTARAGHGRRWGRQLATVAGLTAVWILFWGELSWANLVGGALLAAAILIVFPLPPVTFGGRLRPLGVLVFAADFARELVVANLALSWVAVRPGAPPRSAVIAVPLRVVTDVNVTLIAQVVSLVPGTLVIDVDRVAGVIFAHVLDVPGPARLARARRQVRRVEELLVRALGSAAEVRLVSAPHEGEGPG